MAEKGGVPAAGIICTGFMQTARATADTEGQRHARLVEYPPPNIGVQDEVDVRRGAEDIFDEVLAALSERIDAEEETIAASSGQSDVIFSGGLTDVNEFFYKNRWTDGLPVVPPTLKAVEAFLKFTDRDPDEVLAVMPPGKREATIWKIAVNGVMAGCRPEYMPVLIAIVEALADPRYGIERSGSTAGWSPLIVINGPIIDQLGFHCGTSVMRPGRQANTTIGRFLRLFMINVPGFLPGITDKATFGLNFFVVLAESEAESPWEPLSASLGFEPGDSVVTVNSVLSVSYNFITAGSPREQLEIIVEEAVRAFSQDTILLAFGPERRHMLVLSPLVASILAKGGFSRRAIQQYIFDNARIPAARFDGILHRFWPAETACSLVEKGKLPGHFCRSDDPERVVPLMWGPDELLIIVAGDPTRNRSFIATQCADQGLATSKEIQCPPNWESLLKAINNEVNGWVSNLR